MVTAVSEVHHQPYCKPDYQANPIPLTQAKHHVAVEKDAENRHQWYPRRTEWPGLGRIRAPQHHDRHAHYHERQKGPDINHSSNVINRRDAPYRSGEKSDQNGVLPGGAPLGMDIGEEFLWQQAIIRH